MSRRAPLGHSGRPRLGTVPPRPRRTPPPARCPAQAATTGLGAADPARRPASVAQASPARYGEGADSRPAGHRTTPLSHHVNADNTVDVRDLGLQDGRSRRVEVAGWLSRKPDHPGTIGTRLVSLGGVP